MELFYTINGWAGRNALCDGAMRVFYVAAIPFLATILAALCTFRPRRQVKENAPVSRIFLATILAIAACALLPFLVNALSLSVLETPILSSRPYVTHWVNALVVEPNDNAFPSPEAALIGVLWLAMWTVAPSLAWPTLFYALLFCFARVFCGSNYPVDVLVGLPVGASVFLLIASLLRVPLQCVRRLPWNRFVDTIFPRLRHQALFSTVLCALCVVAFWTFGIALSSHKAKWNAFWSARGQAVLAGTRIVPNANIEYSNRAEKLPVEMAKSASSDTLREGEGGAPMTNAARTNKEIPRPGVCSLGGNLPLEAAQLRTFLQRAGLAHTLVSVDVASLRGDWRRDDVHEEHFASVRFQVRKSGNIERKSVVGSAQRIVQIAFARNPKLQNVDVVGVVVSDPARGKAKYAVFSDGVVPVFSASVARQKLLVTGAQSWLNAPNADAGWWLRARSRLWFNPNVLGAQALRPATPLFLAPTPSHQKPIQSATPKKVSPPTVTPKTISPNAQMPNAKAPNAKTLSPQKAKVFNSVSAERVKSSTRWRH